VDVLGVLLRLQLDDGDTKVVALLVVEEVFLCM